MRAAARKRPARVSASRSPRPTRKHSAASLPTSRPSRAARASRCRYRQFEAEVRAAALTRLDRDRAVHPAHELAGDVEAKPGTAHAAGQIRVDAVELVEDPALLAQRHPEPGVDDAEPHSVVEALDSELDHPAVGRVL